VLANAETPASQEPKVKGVNSYCVALGPGRHSPSCVLTPRLVMMGKGTEYKVKLLRDLRSEKWSLTPPSVPRRSCWLRRRPQGSCKRTLVGDQTSGSIKSGHTSQCRRESCCLLGQYIRGDFRYCDCSKRAVRQEETVLKCRPPQIVYQTGNSRPVVRRDA